MTDQNYNPTELLICTASRLMEDGTTAFIGTGIPMLAAALAQKMHAPNLVSIFEFGGTGAILEELPLAVGERRSFHKAVAASGILDIVETAQRGFVEYGFLVAAFSDFHRQRFPPSAGVSLSEGEFTAALSYFTAKDAENTEGKRF